MPKKTGKEAKTGNEGGGRERKRFRQGQMPRMMGGKKRKNRNKEVRA